MTRSSIASKAPEDSTPSFYPLEIVGIYPTAKAALVKQFSIPEKRARKIIREARFRGSNVILFESPEIPDLLLGVGKIESLWLALGGNKRFIFETQKQAEAFTDNVQKKNLKKNLPAASFLILRNRTPVIHKTFH